MGSPRLDEYFIPKVNSWSEYLLCLGLSPSSSDPRMVREALHPLAATWRSLEACPCSRTLTLGEILGPGFKEGVEQVLALHGWTREWLRTIQLQEQGGSSTSNGLVSYVRQMAQTGLRPRLPQSVTNLFGRTEMPASGLLQPCSSSRSQSRGEQPSISVDSGREEHPEDTLCTRPFASRCLPRAKGRALVSYLQNCFGSSEVPSRSGEGAEDSSRELLQSKKPLVAISFHCDTFVCAETRSAFAHYQAELIRLARDPNRPFDLLGHGHPRWGEFMAKFWKRIGVPYARHFDEVLEKADAFCVDNSSTGPEFASTGRPVAWMSAPWYRRHITHGGRFWEWTYGLPHVTEPEHLLPMIGYALSDPSVVQHCRERMVKSVYGDLCDGQATRRAIDAVVELVNAS